MRCQSARDTDLHAGGSISQSSKKNYYRCRCLKFLHLVTKPCRKYCGGLANGLSM